MRSLYGGMILLPFALLLQKILALQNAFHGTQTHDDSLLLEQVMNHFTAATMLQTHGHDGFDGLLIQTARMRRRTRTAGRQVGIPMLRSSLHPATDGRGLEPRVTSDLTDSPALADQEDSLHSETWKVGIGRVWHTSRRYGRCCQAIEPLRIIRHFKLLMLEYRYN